jgi:hypothetical protein
MKSYKHLFLVCVFAILHFASFAQDSSRLRISLLTCSPGEELYSTFGHSALRVVDSNSVTDNVYNYGTFDFYEKDFYIKFIRGKLKYYVDVSTFWDFQQEYILDNRGITEQVLNFSGEEKEKIRHALNENLKEENKFYMYDFFLDNCTTRLRDIIVKNKQPTPALPAVMPVTYTFRNAIHQYLDNNHKYWSKLGIDLLLGAPTDAVMTPAQQQFLPDNLMYALDSTRNVKITDAPHQAYVVTAKENKGSWFTPTVLFSMILCFFILLSLSKNRYILGILHKLDLLLFLLTGLFGILLIFMWIGTDHTMTKNNYNLLWALPFHAIYAFVMNRNTVRVRMYSLLTAIFLILVLCCWFFLAQQMNNALIPLVLLLIYRSAARGIETLRRREKLNH